VMASVFSYFDMIGAPHFMQKYKVQPGTNEPVDMDKFKRLMKTVFINFWIVGPLYAHVMYSALQWRGYSDVRVLPEFHVVLLEFVVFLIVEEIGFFYAHWMFHHKSVRFHWLYFRRKMLHKLLFSRFTSTFTRSTTSGQHP
jgi:hypothetical protein